MAFDDTHCPCGGHKPPQTMLCTTCETHLADTNEMKAFKDVQTPWQHRRGVAIRLLAMARKRLKAA